MSTIFSFVTVSCTSAPLEVGGVSSTSALISEARTGAIVGSIFSLLALSFRLHPARFHHLVSFDDRSPQTGLPVATMDIGRNQYTGFGAFRHERKFTNGQ